MQNTKLLFLSAILNLCVVGATVFYYAQFGMNTDVVGSAPSTQQLVVQPEPVVVETESVETQVVVSPSPAANTQKLSAPQQKVEPAQAKTISGGCLVKLYDGVYDLAEFKKIHSGGDIFQCNTDMTATFSQTHPQAYLSVLAKYRVQ